MTDWQNTLNTPDATPPPMTEEAGKHPPGTTDLTITAEALAYIVLVVVVGLMLLLQLGSIPLTSDEIPRALASWQAVRTQAPPTTLPDSALIQLGHMFTISALGSGEAAVRFPTALAGTLLVFTPLLFRGLFGRARTFMMCLLLASSPVLLAAARLDNPAIWEMLTAVLGLWAAWQYWQRNIRGYAVAATALLGGTVFLASPTGHVVLISLLLAFMLAERFAPPSDAPTVMETLRGWPWLMGGGLAALTIIVVSTLFMIYPAGLNAVGVAFGNGVRGWVLPVEGAPTFFALASSLLYEPVLWAFGVAGVLQAVYRDQARYVDLFFIAWFGVAVLASVAYAGATAANALWLTFPLVGITSGVVVRLLEDENGWLWFSEEDRITNLFGVTIPGWVRWIVAAGTAGVLLLILMHIGELARTLQTTPLVGNWSNALTALAPPGSILLILVLMLVFIGFTASSVWGNHATLRGGAVGVLAVGMVAMLGTGWQVTHNRANDPRELWHITAYGEDVFLLRDTLIQLAQRENGGFNQLEVVTVADGRAITDSGMIAWILRDFPNVTFVPHEADARAQEVVLVRLTAEPPPLGGNYLGQSFTLRRTWSNATLTAREMPAWWFQRATRTPPQIEQTVVLWLRQDVYEGVDVPGLE